MTNELLLRRIKLYEILGSGDDAIIIIYNFLNNIFSNLIYTKQANGDILYHYNNIKYGVSTIRNGYGLFIADYNRITKKLLLEYILTYDNIDPLLKYFVDRNITERIKTIGMGVSLDIKLPYCLYKINYEILQDNRRFKINSI